MYTENPQIEREKITIRKIQTPFLESNFDIASRDKVYLSGTIYTAPMQPISG